MYSRWQACGVVLAVLAVFLSWGFSACSHPQPSQEEIIKVRGHLIAGVRFESKPFGFLDEHGQLQGYEIDLIREIARRMFGSPQAVEFQQVFSSTRIFALNAGQVDVVAAALSITPARKKIIDFSRSYFLAHQAVLVRSQSSIHTLGDLKGKTILFVSGSTGEANIKKRVPQAIYKGSRSAVEAFSVLQAGQADAMTTDDLFFKEVLEKNCQYRMLPEKVAAEPYGLGFRKGSSSVQDGLMTRINQYLSEMEQDGTLARLQTKWMTPARRPKACAEAESLK